MKKSSSKTPGNKGKQMNSLHNKAPIMHDDPQRRQPPNSQDIQRVQPISQANQKGHMGKPNGPKGNRGPK